MAEPKPASEQRPVSRGALSAGIKLKAGHRVVLLVGAVAGPTAAGEPGSDSSETDGETPGGGAGTNSAGGPSGSAGPGGGSASDYGGGSGAGSTDGSSAAAPGAGRVEVQVLDAAGRPAAGEAWELTLPDGSVKKGATDDEGCIRLTGLAPQGTCQLTFPNVKAPAQGAGGGNP